MIPPPDSQHVTDVKTSNLTASRVITNALICMLMLCALICGDERKKTYKTEFAVTGEKH